MAVIMAILVVLSLYSSNSQRIPLDHVIFPLIISISIALLFIMIMATQVILDGLLIATMFTFVILTWNVFGSVISITLLCLAFSLEIMVKRKGWNRLYKAITGYLFITSIMGVIIALIGIIFFTEAEIPLNQNITSIKSNDNDLPNIYFIVPDRMPSVQAMNEWNIDSSDFTQYLVGQGFLVYSDKQSADPYDRYNPQDTETTRTMRFFASVLNDGEQITLDMPYETVVTKLQQPEIIGQLHELGYETKNVGSWFAETNHIYGFNENYTYESNSLFEKMLSTEFGLAFWQNTLLSGFNFRALIPKDTIANLERDRDYWQGRKIVELARDGGQQFVMAHLLLPHEPFVWRQNDGCEFITTGSNPEVIGLIFRLLPTEEVYIYGEAVKIDTELTTQEAYKQQIIFTMGYLENLTKAIIAFDPTAIIIIQSDEGMAFRKPIELNYEISDIQWNGVFSAYRLPDDDILEYLAHTEILQYVIDELGGY